MALRTQSIKWPGKTTEPPKLTDQQWNVMGLLGLVFIIMALLQLASFTDFKNWLADIGLGGPVLWAVGLIIAELWAAAGLFKLRLGNLFRMVSAFLAVLVAGFWFVENLRLVSDGSSVSLNSSGFFGRFLHQTPGWWSVIEVSVFMLAVLYAMSVFKDNAGTSK